MITPEVIGNAAKKLRKDATDSMDGYGLGMGVPDSYRANMAAADVLDAIAASWRDAMQQEESDK